MSEYKTYQALQNLGLLKGYTITGDNDEKMCEVCQAEQGYHSDFSSSSKFPPFHPNCRCKMELNWRFNSSKNQTLKEVYDPYTGEIKDGATKTLILDSLNNALKDKGLEEELTWEDVEQAGFYDEDLNKIEEYVDDVSKIVGSTTYLDASKVLNIESSPLKDEQNTLDYWLNLAKEDGKKLSKSDPIVEEAYDFYNIFYGVYFTTGGSYDLKSKTKTVFGEVDENGERKYLGLIYDGKFIRYDAISNFLIGYMFYYSGFFWPLNNAETIKKLVEIKSVNHTDDPLDQQAIEDGYNYAKAEDQN